MAIIQTITDEWHFAGWCKQARARDSDYGHFSVEAAKALQAYFDYLSEDTGENIEFDPIAWCVEFTEYNTALEAYNEHHGEDSEGGGTATGEDNTAENAEAQALEWLQDNTTVIEFDGGILVQDF